MSEAALLTAQGSRRAARRPRRAERCFAVAVAGTSGGAGRAERRRQDHAAAGAGGTDARRKARSISAATRCRRCRCASARKRFAYLPQGHVVHWPLPARDIVALGRYPHGATDPARLSPKDAEAVLRAMQAADVVEFSDRRVTELSGGERSRVALARVLAVEAPVILADEPTASLDPRHQIDVMKNLRAAADSGVLVIVVTHDLGLAARFADHVLVLSRRPAGVAGRAGGGAVGAGDGGRVPDQRLSRGISARGRDRAVGGYLMRARLAAFGSLRCALLRCRRRLRRPPTLPRIVSMNVCTDQLLLTLADPEQILGPQPVFARRLAILGGRRAARYPMLSGGAEDVLVLKPDIVVASLFDKRSTRELLKANGLHLAEFAVPRTLDEVKDQIREMGDIAGHPDRAAAEIARLDAAIAARAPGRRGQALSRAAAVAARLGVRQRQFCRLAADRNRACSTRPAISASPSAASPRWRRS